MIIGSTIKWAVAKLTHRDGTKSLVSTMSPSMDWPSKYLADQDIIAVELVQKASRAYFSEPTP